MNIKSISIGDLDQRITVQEAIDTRNSIGERVSSWATALECWADVEIVKAEEKDIGGSNRNVITHNLIIRYSTVPKEKNRVLWKDLTLEISKIQPLDKFQEWMLLECSTCLT
jgi:SPP1 family predicted phage head-tail adaptor